MSARNRHRPWFRTEPVTIDQAVRAWRERFDAEMDAAGMVTVSLGANAPGFSERYIPLREWRDAVVKW